MVKVPCLLRSGTALPVDLLRRCRSSCILEVLLQTEQAMAVHSSVSAVQMPWLPGENGLSRPGSRTNGVQARRVPLSWPGGDTWNAMM